MTPGDREARADWRTSRVAGEGGTPSVEASVSTLAACATPKAMPPAPNARR